MNSPLCLISTRNRGGRGAGPEVRAAGMNLIKQCKFKLRTRMQLTFTYTIEELAEAIAQPGRASRLLQRSGWYIARDLIIYLGLMSLIIALYFLFTRSPHPIPESAQPQDLLIATLAPLSPMLILMALLVISVQATAPGTWRQRRQRATYAQTWMMAALLLSLSLSMVAIFAGHTLLPWRPTRGDALLVALLPTGVTIFAIIVAGRLMLRNQLQRQWDWGVFQRPKIVEITPVEILFSDEASDLRCRWPFFQYAWETPNLLLLASQDDRVFILPKRAFRSVDDLDEAINVIRRNLPDSQTEFASRPPAFPVLRKPPVER
jgi:hypothetical protein